MSEKEPNQSIIRNEIDYTKNKLNELNEKQLLPTLGNQPDIHAQPLQIGPEYSSEQRKAILDDHALSLMVAGAGSGKSHTLIGRVSYLESQGVHPNEIAIVSFTNVAAQNIMTRYPGINSVTLSSMFELFYQTDFGGFNPVISDEDTFITRLRGSGLYHNPYLKNKYKDPHQINHLIHQFANLLATYTHSKGEHHQKLENEMIDFIIHNIEFVCDVVKTINDITIDVESMILFSLYYCYNHNVIPNCHLVVPEEFKYTKYLLVDEAQDTSILDYGILFNIALQMKLNLTLIGDSAQTLYGFRGADAHMFDKLSDNHVFETNKLTNNYRSSNEILMMTNAILNELPIRDDLKIELINHNQPMVTEESFHKAIHFVNYNVDSNDRANYLNDFEMQFKHDQNLVKYIFDSYERHEQIGIMTRNRYLAMILSGWVTQMIYDKYGKNPKLINLSASDGLNDPKLSRVVHAIINNTHNYQNPNPQVFADTFMADFNQYCEKKDSPVYPTQASRMGVALTNLMHNFVKHNFRTNNISERTRYLTNLICNFEDTLGAEAYQQKQASQKALHETGLKNAEIIVSTIHSAKGLEFDHSIILNDESTKHKDFEPDIRMYGVALSRAKKDEYIINLVPAPSASVKTSINDFKNAPLRSTYSACIEKL